MSEYGSDEQLEREEMMLLEAVQNKLKENQAKLPPIDPATGKPVLGAEFCEEEDCGAEIPLQRRQAGYNICVHCKSIQEEKGKQYTQQF